MSTKWETSAGPGDDGTGVEWWVIDAATGDRICAVDSGSQAEANANRIAAAPDLLAALEQCATELTSILQGGGRRGDGIRVRDAARAALAKARGE